MNLTWPTAGQRALDTIEIRQQIFDLLPEETLPVCMLVCKGWMADVARVIYRTLNVFELEEALRVENLTRRTIYLNSIICVQTEEWCTMKDVEDLLKKHRYTDRRVPRADDPADADIAYPSLLNSFIPNVRKACPNLRRYQIDNGLCFGDYERDDYGSDERAMNWGRVFWTFVFTPGTAGGMLHVYEARTCRGTDKTKVLELPVINVYGEYTVKRNFDLQLSDMPSRPSHASTWLQTIVRSPHIDSLSTTIDLGKLPVTLDDMTALYERHRQVSSGTLKRIHATRSEQYTIDDFRALALIAGGSLTSLILTSGASESRKHITFAQLPDIVTLIQLSMPHLRRFAIGVTGWESSESICRDLLSVDITTGTLGFLHIAGAPKNHPCFNAVRFLSRICRRGVNIYICPGRIERSRQIGYGKNLMYSNETAFLEYLHRQPHARRRHLTTVDFDDLEIGTLQEVLDLRYDDEDRPLRRRLYKAELWAAESDTIIDQALRGCEALVGRLVEYKDAVQAFQVGDAADDRKGTIQAGRQFQLAVHRVRLAQEEISRVVDKSVEKELEGYLAALKSLQVKQAA